MTNRQRKVSTYKWNQWKNQPTNQNKSSELEPISELEETIQRTNKKNEETNTNEKGKKWKNWIRDSTKRQKSQAHSNEEKTISELETQQIRETSSKDTFQ